MRHMTLILLMPFLTAAQSFPTDDAADLWLKKSANSGVEDGNRGHDCPRTLPRHNAFDMLGEDDAARPGSANGSDIAESEAGGTHEHARKNLRQPEELSSFGSTDGSQTPYSDLYLWSTGSIPTEVTVAESIGVFSGSYMIQSAATLPVFEAANLFVEGQAPRMLPAPQPLPSQFTNQCAAMDRGFVTVGARWLPPGKNSLQASASFQFDASRDKHPVERVNLHVKSILSELFFPLFLDGDLQAQSDRSDRERISLIAGGNGSTMTANVGLTRQATPNRRRPARHGLDWGIRFAFYDGLYAGARMNYDLNAHNLQTFLYLEIQVAMPSARRLFMLPH
jgi:hypothetical protein